MDELLKQKLAAIAAIEAVDAKLKALLAHDELSEAQLAEHASLKAERVKVKAKIARIEDAISDAAETGKLQADAATQRAEAERAQRRQPSTRITSPDNPTPNATTVPATPIERDPRGGFRTPREFISAVVEWGCNRAHDNRLAGRMAVGSDEARGNSDPAGGFLLPEAFHPDLLNIASEADPMGGLTRPFPMDMPIVNINARVDKNHATSVSGGLTVTRHPETVAGTPSMMTFEQIRLEAHELFGLSYATERLLTDSPRSFIAILEAGFRDQFTSHLIDERLNGTGAGEFMGIMNSACLVTVNKESGQSNDTIVKENIDKMRARCWGYGRAVWLANHDCLPQLSSLVQVVGVGGGPVGYFSVDANGNASLMGRPLMFTEYAKTIGDLGDLVLGNWGEYLEGLYQPLQSAESVHVRFVNHERVLKIWLRNAGSPWWSSPLTPKNGSGTLSPFVVLQAR